MIDPIKRAERAAALQNDPMLNAAFDDARKAILEAWASMSSGDSDKAKDLHRQLKCLDLIKTVIQKHIDTGIIAQKELDRMKGKKRLF